MLEARSDATPPGIGAIKLWNFYMPDRNLTPAHFKDHQLSICDTFKRNLPRHAVPITVTTTEEVDPWLQVLQRVASNSSTAVFI